LDLSPCIEWHFADENPDMGDRIRASAAAGYAAGEFHLWRDKDVDSASQALDQTGVRLTGICVDPRRSLVDPAQHDEFLQAVEESLVAAKKLGSPPMIIASGFTREGVSEAEHFAAAASVLRRAATLAEEADVMLLLEPLNDRVEHPGMWLVSTSKGLDLIEAVGNPRLRLLYDVYHSAVMGEDMAEVLRGRLHLVHHVQVADMPGRNEPGTGTIDWPGVMRTLRELGYEGSIGLEYRPTMPILESLAASRAALGL